jgi:hypothetical protein
LRAHRLGESSARDPREPRRSRPVVFGRQGRPGVGFSECVAFIECVWRLCDNARSVRKFGRYDSCSLGRAWKYSPKLLIGISSSRPLQSWPSLRSEEPGWRAGKRSATDTWERPLSAASISHSSNHRTRAGFTAASIRICAATRSTNSAEALRDTLPPFALQDVAREGTGSKRAPGRSRRTRTDCPADCSARHRTVPLGRLVRLHRPSTESPAGFIDVE